VEVGDISRTLTYTGSIEPRREVQIVPDVAGKIARIYVEEGQYVKEGQVLAELDTRAAKLQLEQAKAGLAVAKANFHDAERNWNRIQELYQKGTVSPQQYEKVKLAYEAARAQLQQAQAALHLAEYNLEVSVMKAPFSGFVTHKGKKEGDVINPMMGGFGGAMGVVTLMDISEVKISLQVPEHEIVDIRKGQRAEVRVDAYPNRVFEGKVTLVNMAADPLSKTFMVQVTVPNPDFALRPGLFARVTIHSLVHRQALLVPSKAVLEGDIVFVAQGDKAVERRVRTGIRQGDKVEILEGLQQGERVIVEGNYGLEDGAPIVVQKSGGS